MLARSHQTITIEEMLSNGQSQTSIARQMGITRQRVGKIAKRLTSCTQPVAGGGLRGGPSGIVAPVKSLTLQLTPAVFAALVEACQVSNHKDPEEQITITDYVEQVLINNLVEMGLMRKHRKHTK
jgi:hypothetical protein